MMIHLGMVWDEEQDCYISRGYILAKAIWQEFYPKSPAYSQAHHNITETLQQCVENKVKLYHPPLEERAESLYKTDDEIITYLQNSVINSACHLAQCFS